METVIILGAGASGMVAALTAAESKNRRVLLLERQQRVGRKLLATGNGRCNLTNTGASPARYHGAEADFVRPALAAFPPEAALEFFRELGLVTVTEPGGRVYPLSDSANSVVDVLRFALDAAGVELRAACPARALRREKQGGKSLEVSILMSDLRGFTAISQRLPSGDLINMVNHYFGEMAAVIQRHRGTIIEFLGDGIFVVFGAPREFSDHAEAAVACAIEMQNAMAGVNAWNLEHGYPELDMGIGIHSGPVIAGNIGSDQKMKYGCIGETCNLAGRLESFCLGGEVCVTKATRDRINGKLKILMESSFLPKGSRKKLVFYSVGGIEGKSALSGVEKIRWRKLPKAKEVAAAAPKKAEKAKGEKSAKKGGIFAKIGTYFRDVKSELHRVVWPSKRELRNYSVAAIAMLIVFGVFFWLVDTGFIALLVGFTGLRR